VKILRSSVPRDKDFWRSPWGKILRNPHAAKIPGNNFYCKRYRRRFRISYELFYRMASGVRMAGVIPVGSLVM
jgi:hypothetical protein